ncbi:hypothetical protein TraAM80_06184 [Trypanosoma rangeli]|uniref:Uncharacterized protein n=1 Tax=Trypanosoma rangeli TaxID=5698 RepID=A0A3R7RHE3_TRYRA|nr:uncharacterized protein TraAM80_06184 [Trypanosoma rangeli]RNF02732.1 hypothetical protein TraAM80_06184 [Trypanosoma rangeli]|eukprot:RNF02732.1 hypothetical protein TraAM80_06184 [Trypanosoma rangeli]
MLNFATSLSCFIFIPFFFVCVGYCACGCAVAAAIGWPCTACRLCILTLVPYCGHPSSRHVGREAVEGRFGYAEEGGRMTQPNSPRGRPLILSSFQWSSDAQIAIDETALTQAFLYRRRRMEAASRLTDGMMAQVQTIVDADGSPSYVMLMDEVPESTDESPQRKQKDSVCATPGGGRGEVSVENTMTHATEVLLHDDINRKAEKIRDMRIEQRSAAEMQLKPTFLLVEPSLELPIPPTTFTSTSLAFALEALAKSVSKLVAATDGILVQLSALDKTNQPSIFKEMNILVVHTQHAWRCHAAVMQHLKQYEVCAKALQDGTLQELSSMREQFLVCKEMLTAQEQKQKVSEEHLRALRLRLNNLHARCRMWSGILLGATPLLPLLVSPSNSPSGTSLLRERDSISCMRSVTNRAQSATPHLSFVAGASTRQRSSVRVRTPSLSQNLDSPHFSISTAEELEDHMNAMEVKVARFWSNPYVVKAQQCAERMWRQRHQPWDRSTTLVEVMKLPVLSRNESVQRTGSSLRLASEMHRASRVDNLHKGGHAAEATDKATAEVRLMSLLRGLLRLAPSVKNQADAGASSSSAEGAEGVEGNETIAVENDIGSGEASISRTPYGDAFEAAGVTVGTADAMSESVRNLLKFLEEASTTVM